MSCDLHSDLLTRLLPGSTFLSLTTSLKIQLPILDPSIFISRFAALLEFKDETQQVAADATRLAQRFSRDWMQTGRRPAGVCGACLFLAAKMNNFRRSFAEIIQVVKIADSTLRKRLDEFKATESSNLSIEEFRTQWLAEHSTPPVVAQSERDRKRKLLLAEKKLKKAQRRERGEGSDSEEDELDDDAASNAVAGSSRSQSGTPARDVSMPPPPSRKGKERATALVRSSSVVDPIASARSSASPPPSTLR